MDKELIGYADEWSVAPGDRLTFRVSTSAAEYAVDLVRLRHGDPRPVSPGLKESVITSQVHGPLPGSIQATRSGSCVVVPPDPMLSHLQRVTLRLWAWPTLPSNRIEQGLISNLCSDPPGGWGLLLDAEGRFCFRLVGEKGTHTVVGERGVLARQWYLLSAHYDAATGTASLAQQSLRVHTDSFMVTRMIDIGALLPSSEPLLIGALRNKPDPERRTWASGHYEGKIENPSILGRPSGHKSSAAPFQLAEQVNEDTLIAVWDFAGLPDSDQVIDMGPNSLHGRLVNLPMRAVAGHNWTGEVLDFKAAPREYGAIHFHSDDLEDAAWDRSFDISIPLELQSGIYAARLRADGLVDRVPFVVRPGEGRPPADVALLLPTLTYLAYANEQPPRQDTYLRHLENVALGPQDQWLDGHRELERSLYDRHADGSGCCYASRLRPIPNLRPDYLHWASDEPRHLGRDLYIVDWLEELEIVHDVITDEDLHQKGLQILEPYRVVLTGSHPEYCTARMLDAFEEYLWNGGRLMYLGGNGFYWVTSLHSERRHAIEVRRGVNAERAWRSAPGEEYHATSGEPGGLWRFRGRAPNRLVGVGFTAMGSDGKQEWQSAYWRTPESFDPTVEWIFQGVTADEPIGQFGLIMGTAAGHEMDRYDDSLGSPRHAFLLASSKGHGPGYQLAIENLPMHYMESLRDHMDSAHPDARADLVFFETAKGGAVFSVSSMCWVGSLSHNGYRNNVARITENVLRGFMSQMTPWASGK